MGTCLLRLTAKQLAELFESMKEKDLSIMVIVCKENTMLNIFHEAEKNNDCKEE